ncbi:MAG: replication-associated recombination protein A [Clostridia bacterium]|nr:replication-associated recombination protein A [Clostridia bacterium]
MDLFDYSMEKRLAKEAPLAVRMRPKNLDEFVGQEHIIGPGKFLRRAIEADRLGSIILYGPPGSGKTALVHIIANTTSANFIKINAVTSGIGEIKEIIETAKKDLGMYGKKTILFIDEIHRFNKAQQDVLLPHVENGIIILIGATTENPYFEVNPPLLSRARVYKLERLTRDEIKKILLRALSDKERGLGNESIKIDDEVLDYLSDVSGGDARVALNAMELAVLTTEEKESGVKEISIDIINDCLQKRSLSYDKTGDNHYDVASAFIKSMRGSDPDAALHWLARMLEAGEDPRFICRRMIILASEDIGLADPQALTIAVSAAQALDYVGLPEARFALAQAAVYLSCAPKSNSVKKAVEKALYDVRKKDIGTVPIHLRDASYSGAKKLGHGKGYLYPHDFPGNFVEQEYLPEPLRDSRYYYPGDNGMERVFRSRIIKMKEKNKSQNNPR